MLKAKIPALFLMLFLTASGLIAADNPLQTPKVWKKGQLHVHTLWSDGRDFPETMLAAYQKNAFDFVVITDHDVVGSDKDVYLQIFSTSGGWPPLASRDAFKRLQASAPAELIKTKRIAYRTFVRLSPYDELQKNWEIPGRFLILPGEEITVFNVGKDRRQVHVNYVNMTQTILPQKGKDAAETLKISSDNILKSAAKTPPKPVFFMANHPQWKLWDLQVEDFLQNPQYRHFELINGYYGFAPPKKVHSLEQFWDIINAFRLINGQKIIYAVGSDDSHFGDAEHYGKVSGVNSAWVYVGLPDNEEFTHDNLVRALNEGRFYPSSGVEFESVKFDDKTRTLKVKVKAQPGRKYKIRFNATTADFDRKTGSMFLQHGKLKHTVKTYSPEIGQTVKVVEGSTGECKLLDNWLYLRATVISDEPLPRGKNIWYDSEPFKKAWTQPVVNKKFLKK